MSNNHYTAPRLGKLESEDPRDNGWRNRDRLRDAQVYLATKELETAVNVALTLGMPLLVTGEPGSGKSRLAYSIAWRLALGEPLSFTVKSDTVARDLFYQFDHVARFHTANLRERIGSGLDASIEAQNYVTLNALGRAILYAKDAYFSQQVLGFPEERVNHPGSRTRSVVLIDEIDKAPRDVPNDMLVEIDEMRFEIAEMARTNVHARAIALDKSNDKSHWPIVVFTSNSERALPEPFLRRCVYYHMPFPPFANHAATAAKSPASNAITVEDIIASRFNQGQSLLPRHQQAVSLHQRLREAMDKRGARKPSLAELINFVQLLEAQSVSFTDLDALKNIAAAILGKNLDQDDRKAFEDEVTQWFEGQPSSGTKPAEPLGDPSLPL